MRLPCPLLLALLLNACSGADGNPAAVDAVVPFSDAGTGTTDAAAPPTPDAAAADAQPPVPDAVLGPPDAAQPPVPDAALGPPPDAAPDAAPIFTFTSPAFEDGGDLPAVYTCDGAGHSPPLAWGGVPAGTQELALLMTTLALDGLKWNWVLYHLPPDSTGLAEDEHGIGTAGRTSDGPQLAYAPPCSQGPGAKQYTFTLYALSGPVALDVTADRVTGDVLTAALAPLTLDARAMTVSYSR